MSKVLFLISPSLNSFADKRKGTSGNKIDCAFQHYKNSTVSNFQIGAAAGAAALAGKIAVGKNAELAARVAEMGMFKKIGTYIKNAPKAVKIAAAALAGLSLLVRTYKKGKIEQKYLDRAQFVDHTFTLDGEGTKASAPLKAAAK